MWVMFLLIVVLVILYFFQERVLPVFKWLWAWLKKSWKHLARPPGVDTASSGAKESVIDRMKAWWSGLITKLGIG